MALYDDWQAGHTPVTLGRAPWVTDPFWQAMHVCATEIATADSAALDAIGEGA